MSRIQASISKVTKPRLAKVYPRTRLFRTLDNSRDIPVTWLSGPAGSGKTTLIASYLDSRKLPCIWFQVDEGDADLATFFYYMGLAGKKAAPRSRRPLPLLTSEYSFGIPIFARRYFENICGRLGRPYTIVFDNYQTIPLDSPFHEIIQTGLSGIPEGIRVIVISRTDPPPAFAGMHAGNKITVVGWDDLRLTPDESKGIMRLEKEKGFSSELVKQMLDKAQGWAAGLVLMTKGVRSAGGASPGFEGLGPENIFDYFANELFDKAESRIKDFLIKTSFLPQMTVPMAEKLTGIHDPGRILSDLSRSNYFTEKRQLAETSYQYHPLFREFLLSRAQTALSRSEVSRMRLLSAELLEKGGRIEDAAELYRSAGEWSRFIPLVLAHAPTLAVQGRSKTLEQWLLSIPGEMTAQTPWLLYWMGVCRLANNPVEARALFAKAFESFKEQNDPAGQFLSWSQAIDSFIYGWDTFTDMDRWIREMEILLKRHPAFPSEEIGARAAINMFSALFLWQPFNPALPLWEKRVSALMGVVTDINVLLLVAQRLLLYYTFVGDLARADLVYRRLQGAVIRPDVNPPAYIASQVIKAYYFWFRGSIGECQKAVAEGLKAAGDTGVYLMNFMLSSVGAYSSLAAGDLQAAQGHIDNMAAQAHGRLGDAGHYHYIISWNAMLRGDIALAKEHGVMHRDIALQMGGPPFFTGLNHVAYAHTLWACGEHTEAQVQLRASRRIGEETKSALIMYKCLLAEAYFSLERGREKECRRQLAEAFSIGRKKQLYSIDWWLPDVMARLCMFALDHGVEVEYAQELIKKRNLGPPVSQGEGIWSESWPWAVKIITLGRFRIELDGRPVQFSGKIQKKPLEMLKALIAFGGRNVSEDNITDALWPDAEGDLGHKSFETTLQRLRRLIGKSPQPPFDKGGEGGIIRLQDGRLSLDERLCWVDVWAFEHALESTEYPRLRPSGAGSVQSSELKGEKKQSQMEKALSLYHGHFLPGDGRLAWSAVARERLRSRFINLIVKAGEALEAAGQWKKAGELFEQGIEKDAVCEEFYQHLMICHKKLGQETRAAEVYKRCRLMLSREFGLQPSSRTEEIRRSLARAGR